MPNPNCIKGITHGKTWVIFYFPGDQDGAAKGD